jgi:hypothetical protein
VHRSELKDAGYREALRKALAFDAVGRWMADPGSRFWALGMAELVERPSPVGGFLSEYVTVELCFTAVLRPETLPVGPQGVLDLEAYQAVAYGPGNALKLDPDVRPEWSVWSEPFDPEAADAGYIERIGHVLVRDALRMWAADPRSHWWIPEWFDIAVSDDPRMSGAAARIEPGSFAVPNLRSVRVMIRPRRLEFDEPNQPG